MLPGVYIAYKKNGTAYYRASVTYRNKHISLGSFHTEEDANLAYREAGRLLQGMPASMEDAFSLPTILSLT